MSTVPARTSPAATRSVRDGDNTSHGQKVGHRSDGADVGMLLARPSDGQSTRYHLVVLPMNHRSKATAREMAGGLVHEVVIDEAIASATTLSA